MKNTRLSGNPVIDAGVRVKHVDEAEKDWLVGLRPSWAADSLRSRTLTRKFDIVSGSDGSGGPKKGRPTEDSTASLWTRRLAPTRRYRHMPCKRCLPP